MDRCIQCGETNPDLLTTRHSRKDGKPFTLCDNCALWPTSQQAPHCWLCRQEGRLNTHRLTGSKYGHICYRHLRIWKNKPQHEKIQIAKLRHQQQNSSCEICGSTHNLRHSKPGKDLHWFCISCLRNHLRTKP